LVRNITNIGDLRKYQSFVVHADRGGSRGGRLGQMPP